MCDAGPRQPDAIDARVIQIARDIRAEGGRALLVGGFVRDLLRGEPCTDLDVEVFGLTGAALHAVLSKHGEAIEVGRAFGVFRVKGLDVDFSLPRSHSLPRAGGQPIGVAFDAGLDFASAARRRDLTVNSIALDPLSGAFEDPHGGRADIAARRLRATDAAHFADDPLRGLRVAQLAARFRMRPDRELSRLCAGLSLDGVSPERVFGEFRKLLLRAERPSVGLAFLRECGLITFFPELGALIGVPQDPRWHPEGDVWVHTLMVVDEAARLRRGDENDLSLMFAALGHDLGKPDTTVESDHVRSIAHDVRGVAIGERLLERMRAPGALTRAVCALVRHHLAPAWLIAEGAGGGAYRKLARRLAEAGTTMQMLERVARSDHLGRTTADAIARRFPAGDAFLARAEEFAVARAPRRDAVMGRHLIARGFVPGRHFSQILARCRELQDETGWNDAHRLLDVVLAAGEQPS